MKGVAAAGQRKLLGWMEHLLLGANFWSPLQYTSKKRAEGDSFFCNTV